MYGALRSFSVVTIVSGGISGICDIVYALGIKPFEVEHVAVWNGVPTLHGRPLP